jgi:nucleotide-binding universal stress UspA family protein
VCQYVREKSIDLIVMTTHGRSGISRLVYGSVAEHILHNAKIPVLLVRALRTGNP